MNRDFMKHENIDKCSNCLTTKSKQFWDYSDGSVLCDNCEKKLSKYWEFKANLLKPFKNLFASKKAPTYKSDKNILPISVGLKGLAIGGILIAIVELLTIEPAYGLGLMVGTICLGTVLLLIWAGVAKIKKETKTVFTGRNYSRTIITSLIIYGTFNPDAYSSPLNRIEGIILWGIIFAIIIVIKRRFFPLDFHDAKKPFVNKV